MNKWIVIVLSLLAMLALLPMVFIAKSRVTLSEKPPVHLFPDMDNQPRFKAQMANPLFADARASRLPVEGTVARGFLRDDAHLYRGVVGEGWAGEFPESIDIDESALARGQERYGIFCSPCHGLSGYGNGIIAQRADQLQEGTWVPPSSFHTELVRGRPVGHLFNTVTHGIRNMAGYGSQITVEDRWAIVAYVRALQRSQFATVEDVPESVRPNLR